MRFSTISFQFLALVATGAEAWQVAAYDSAHSCYALFAPRIRMISGGPELNDCFTFDQPMPGTACTEEFPGGTRSCTSGSLLPTSVRFFGSECDAYTEPNCDGFRSILNTGCGPTCLHMAVRSFRCYG
ncbi:hypothetical protein QBC44DRAFT_304074 [Cladorrhinum sp. PSN332]|nr:hypothetical protein QBC44DRAFT_304074 [Cladorrhinum sp. PSN332]